MKITKIEKKKRLYLLEIDETEKLYVTEDTIVRYFLSKGMTLDDKTLEEIKNFAQYSHGKNLALYYISFKQRTEKEVKDYLFQHEIEARIIYKVLDNLREDKWLDDQKYAESFINQNLSTGDKGPHVLSQKLLEKGISKEIITQVLGDNDFENLLEKQAKKLLKKYSHKLPARALKDKVAQSLQNKGFHYTDIQGYLNQLDIEKDEELEEDLLLKEIDKVYRKYQKKYDGYDLKQRMTQALMRKGFDYSEIKANLREYF
ncbi:recombination regulator RecX [Streptococcus loxodontisalivarius]|uniref:Regulatory protein RecX n=1 Tax=Streptococcus loxodontisalivarius TaxID=1349415 RepID=A0ABS2PPR8_9STRE|nr:recombination regulator RecX [Streptococcus loxodontisalivarius]MBM7642027.1 regulatory protein [Streptococcus loxodontisalivarius]